MAGAWGGLTQLCCCCGRGRVAAAAAVLLAAWGWRPAQPFGTFDHFIFAIIHHACALDPRPHVGRGERHGGASHVVPAFSQYQ
eukprot:COSAG01_NODE_2552_length_7463_cov_644.066947_4_plen_83_part_00